MTDVALVWTGKVLTPYQQQDLDVLNEDFHAGELVSTKVTKARNLGHHRKLFALLRAAVKSGAVMDGYTFNDPEALRAFVLIKIGWCDWSDMPWGRTPIARSINFSSVDQRKFEPIYEQAILYLADEISPDCEDLVYEADEMISKGVVRGAIPAT